MDGASLSVFPTFTSRRIILSSVTFDYAIGVPRWRRVRQREREREGHFRHSLKKSSVDETRVGPQGTSYHERVTPEIITWMVSRNKCLRTEIAIPLSRAFEDRDASVLRACKCYSHRDATVRTSCWIYVRKRRTRSCTRMSRQTQQTRSCE